MRINFRYPGCLAGVVLAVLLAPPAQSILPSEMGLRSEVGPPSCPWPEASGPRLLDRKVADVAVTDAPVPVVWSALVDQHVPISFIESDTEAMLTLDLRGATVRQVLDAVVARAPAYQYGLVADRLVMYSRSPVWKARLDNVNLGPGPRQRVTRALVEEISRRVPDLANLDGPNTVGDPRSYVFQDVVSVSGTGSLLELLVLLLGDRPSAMFVVGKARSGVPQLSVGGAVLLQAVHLSTPTTILQLRGEPVQLKVLGTLYGGTPKDLSAAACATVYWVSDEKVLRVSPDGLLTAVGSGEARVKASNQDVWDSVTIKVRN
jgi:hypothetical protein